MSVTFTIESNPTGAFVIECDEVVVAQADSYEGIMVERAAHMLVCKDCQHYGCYTQAAMDVSGDLDVNMANGNARMMLVRLGLDDKDLCGTATAEQFLGAVMLAGALADDSAVADVETTVPGGPRWIECGTPEGYISGRLEALAALGTEAARLGRDIIWS